MSSIPSPRRGRVSVGLLLVLAIGSACALQEGRASEPEPGRALRLPAVFSDHMVLQQRRRVPLWGWTTPGATVTVTPDWAGAAAVRAVASADGRFEARLDTPVAGGPYTLTVADDAGATLTLGDVLVGEVWLCGGQSNMEQTLATGTHAGYGTAGAEALLPTMDRPTLRVFDVAHDVGTAPAQDVTGQWVVSTPESAGVFSATATFFALRLMEELDVPVGLLCSNWGGTRAEAWTSEATVAHFERFAGDLDKLAAVRSDPEGAAAALLRQRDDWWRALDAVDPGSGRPAPWAAVDLDATGWTDTTQPASFAEMGIGGKDGVVWLRREVDVPGAWAGQPLELHLGPIDDMDSVYWGGERLTGSELPGVWNTPRHYTIPGERVAGGATVLAVRVLDTGGAGGIRGEAGQLRLALGDQDLPLAGSWGMRPGIDLSELAPFPSQGWFGRDTPTALFNAMLAPLVGYGIAGAIWYQGESNRYDPATYAELFPAMIEDWRQQWGQTFPFHFVQIAPFAYGGDKGQAAAIRDAQRHALRLPRTGMAVTMDIGDPANIHPAAKRQVGERLALWALADPYERDDLVVSGPLPRRVARDGRRLRVHFDHGEGLHARGGPPSHLELAGADGVFHPATGAIEGTTLLVGSAAVVDPVSVRYAWGAADEPNLFGGTGLPASSFREDL